MSKDLAPELRSALESDPRALQLYQASAQYRMTVELWSHLLDGIREEMHAAGIPGEIARDVIRAAVARGLTEQGEAAARAEVARRFALESEVGRVLPGRL